MRSPVITRPRLSIVTYNIHKGFSQFNRRMMIHELRERLRTLDPDIVFLQEVQGLHRGHSSDYEDWPGTPQHEFLAEDVWETAYGMNAVYAHGHHGNAILSRFPITFTQNQDISELAFERRGLLHCALAVPQFDQPLHCVCVHLGLTATARRRQLDALAERMERYAAAGAPLIVAGDFNDWHRRASDYLNRELGLYEVFERAEGRPARSYPAQLPMLTLDRIYVRDMDVEAVQRHVGAPWSKLSDHVALAAKLTR